MCDNGEGVSRNRKITGAKSTRATSNMLGLSRNLQTLPQLWEGWWSLKKSWSKAKKQTGSRQDRWAKEYSGRAHEGDYGIARSQTARFLLMFEQFALWIFLCIYMQLYEHKQEKHQQQEKQEEEEVERGQRLQQKE